MNTKVGEGYAKILRRYENSCPYLPYYLYSFLSYTSFTHFFFSSYSAAYGETSFSQKRMNELSLILEWNSFCTPLSRISVSVSGRVSFQSGTDDGTVGGWHLYFFYADKSIFSPVILLFMIDRPGLFN